jgi:hypothetical protein
MIEIEIEIDRTPKIEEQIIDRLLRIEIDTLVRVEIIVATILKEENVATILKEENVVTILKEENIVIILKEENIAMILKGENIREEEMIEEIPKVEVILKIETTTRAVVQVIMIQGQRGGALIGMTFALIVRSLRGIPQRITRGETARIRIPIEILEKILKVMIGEIRASLLLEIIIILIRIIEEGARIGRMILEMIDLDLER